MKKINRFISCIILTIVICSFMSNKVYAAEELEQYKVEITNESLANSNDPIVRENIEILLQAQKRFEKMDEDELNNYIDTSLILMDSKVAANSTFTIVELKTMWLAAAQVAKLKGYTCSAKLVECSVLGLNYSETTGDSGLIRDKIVTTQTYKNILSGVNSKKYPLNKKVGGYFSKSENADLYYAIASFDFTPSKPGQRINITFTDTYNFEPAKYNDIFTGTVNNWAVLCQYTGVLNQIFVSVKVA